MNCDCNVVHCRHAASRRPKPRPAPLCPKCGDSFGFVGASPTYRSGWAPGEIANVLLEWLEWECRVCSYPVKTECFDA